MARHPCPYCERTFKSQAALADHVIASTHLDDANFGMSRYCWCGRMFWVGDEGVYECDRLKDHLLKQGDIFAHFLASKLGVADA